jgi:hypothetical protein
VIDLLRAAGVVQRECERHRKQLRPLVDLKEAPEILANLKRIRRRARD